MPPYRPALVTTQRRHPHGTGDYKPGCRQASAGEEHRMLPGMQAAFLAATVIALAAVVLSAMMRKTEGAGGHGGH